MKRMRWPWLTVENFYPKPLPLLPPPIGRIDLSPKKATPSEPATETPEKKTDARRQKRTSQNSELANEEPVITDLPSRPVPTDDAVSDDLSKKAEVPPLTKGAVIDKTKPWTKPSRQ